MDRSAGYYIGLGIDEATRGVELILACDLLMYVIIMAICLYLWWRHPGAG